MVGLFRNAGPRRASNASASDWTLESTNDGEKKMFFQEIAQRRKEQGISSCVGIVPVTINCDVSATTPTECESNVADPLLLKVHLLEQQLKETRREKDETISNLHKALEREDDRVTRMEIQVGTLIEMSTKQCAGQKTVTKRTSSAPKLSNLSSRQDVEAKLEISALQELLTRVIAEKDRVMHENITLKGLLRPAKRDVSRRLAKSANDGVKTSPSRPTSTVDALGMASRGRRRATVDVSDMPVKELLRPKRVVPQRLTKSVKDGVKTSPRPKSTVDGSGMASRGRRRTVDMSDMPSEESKGLPKCIPGMARSSSQVDFGTKKESQHSFLYQMSCRTCTGNYCHIPYSSTFTTDHDDHTKELPKVLKKHYRQVWQILQQHESTDDAESICSSVRGDEWVKTDMYADFPSSSFARHVAKHCQYLEDEAAVLKWCMKNVRVQMQKNVR